MDKIIAQLSDIENTAISIINHTDIEKKQYEQDSLQMRLAFDKQLLENTNTTLKHIRDELQTNLNVALLTLRENNETTLNAFDEEYYLHHEDYARQILKHISEV